MSNFRSRLVLGLLTLVLVSFVGLGILLGQLFKSFYTNTYIERLEKEAEFVTSFMELEDIVQNEVKGQLIKLEQVLNSNVIVFNLEGDILFNSSGDEVKEEFIQKYDPFMNVNKNQAFYDIDEQNGELFYFAPFQNDSNQKKGYLLINVPAESLKNINNQIWLLLTSSFALAFVVILLVGAQITKYYLKPIEEATNVANELAKGNYKARTTENYLAETGMLNRSINILAQNIQKMIKNQEMQQDRLTTLIENMGMGLILIDNLGYISLINRTYKEIFDVDTNDYVNRLYYTAIQHEEVIAIVEEIFMTEHKARKVMLLPLKIERKHFEVYGAPIIGMNEEWKGIVLVFHDISELKKLEQIRRDFVANVSHELKTPITSIKGFSETLLDGAMEDKEVTKNFLSIILKESDRLQNLIQDLLDLSKLESHTIMINWQEVNITEILEDVIFMLKTKADQKKIRLELAEENSVVIKGDMYRLKQVFINLISNGIAYSHPESKVSVFIENLQDSIEVNVKDTGIGIKDSEIPRIFERFYRVDKARDRNSGGTGLGLAIVKHIVEAHGGSVKVFSKQGEGTTFTVILRK